MKTKKNIKRRVPEPGSLSTPSVPSRQNRTLKQAVVVVFLLSLLGSGYLCIEKTTLSNDLVTDLSAFLGPVEHNPDGSLLIRGGDQVSIATLDLRLKPDTDYLLSARVRGSAEVHLDFYGDRGDGRIYDSANQELVIQRGTREPEYLYRFNSEDPPDNTVLRVFFMDEAPVIVDSISVQQALPSAGLIRAVMLSLAFALLAWFAYPLRGNLMIQAFGLCSAAVVTYFLVDVPESQNVGDNALYVPSSQSLLREGNFDVNEYSAWFPSDPDTLDGKARSAFGRKYNFFPVGVSIVVLPFVFVGDILIPGDPLTLNKTLAIASGSAKVLAALSVSLMFLLAFELTWKNKAVSLTLALVFGFATSHFSAHGGGLWSHNAAALAFVSGLYLIVWKGGRFAWLAALPLALGYLSRPDFSMVIVVMSLYVFLHLRQSFLAFVAIGLSVLAWFAAWSYSVYGQWLPPYYLAERVGSGTFWEALAGNLISPNRGLFVFTPIAFFSLYGGYLAFKERQTTPPLYRYLFVVTSLHWIAISSFPHWWAGYSYGPRFFCSVLPGLTLLLLPVVGKWEALPTIRQRLTTAALFGVLVGFSLFVQIRGATSLEVQSWNATPVSVDVQPERIWDWRDWQPIRGLH